ncbi:Crp/Fnr family transcriptional regulator [Magnetospirillum fulvum]|uniref:cAMP-binding domain of CRP or a regulatory subunit of cAMP-dependent protein kinases n=1 Tax=Magnetospirillum fulvum TaxID=1082 RepID=A0A1H6HJ21_MAGFU|nr:Crp/Fnr family transcriptional regulator [Magnetospirillum fulvum]SEH33963.1 cAMP-binding domain of CRP or a regulatory subunit of cAMP-dependent protein kinases [Magnetospirillum fulvum]
MPLPSPLPSAFLSPSLHLSEDMAATDGSNLLAALSEEELAGLRAVSGTRRIPAGSLVFRQGDHHEGIFIILSGRVRIFYTGPVGREITLAYWSPGNFIGGPEMFGGSQHMWSGIAIRQTEVMAVRGTDLRRLIERSSRLGLAMVDAMVHKGKCMSALIHMLGTRSASERLARLLVLMGEMDGRRHEGGIAIGRSLTQEDLARMVGSTRQWVGSTLDKFRRTGLVEVTPNRILIRDEVGLRHFTQ